MSKTKGSPIRHKYFAVELFCGSARFSAAMEALGLSCLGVDYIRNASIPESFTVSLDLCLAENWNTIRSFAASGTVFFMLEPPCGTASRAREIPISVHLREQGVPQPRPLRTEETPDGVDGLTEIEMLRLTNANLIYMHVGEFVKWIVDNNLFFVIENPYRSLFW
jgi:hypothetical protein